MTSMVSLLLTHCRASIPALTSTNVTKLAWTSLSTASLPWPMFVAQAAAPHIDSASNSTLIYLLPQRVANVGVPRVLCTVRLYHLCAPRIINKPILFLLLWAANLSCLAISPWKTTSLRLHKISQPLVPYGNLHWGLIRSLAPGRSHSNRRPVFIEKP